MKKTTIWAVITVLIVIIAGYLLYLNQVEEPDQKETIKIAAIQPLTGKVSYVGEWVSQGIDLAIEELNNDGYQIEIIYEDDVCDPAKAVSALNKLINVDGVKVIIGPTCSSSVLAVAPIAEESKVIVFSTVATSTKISDSGDYIFRNRESDLDHGRIMAKFAFNQLNARKAGVLFLNLDNGIAFKESFERKFTELGGEVVAEESYTFEDPDYRTQLTKIKEANPDVLYFAGQRMENAIVQARELGLEQKILGPSTMQNKKIIEVAGQAAEGLIYTYPDFSINTTTVDAYQEAYKNKYDIESEVYAANSYDAVKILVKAIDKCNEDTDCIKSYLYNMEEYAGVSGVYDFNENGDVTKPLTIKTVKGGEFVKYD